MIVSLNVMWAIFLRYAGVAHDEADRSVADSPRLAFFYSDASFQGFGFDIKYSSGAQTLGMLQKLFSQLEYSCK